MPVPFRDQDEVDELGSAAFLRVEADPERAGFRGALFQINARGEPVEFTYNRVGTPNTFLWRPGDLRRAALKKLAASLLATCSRAPRLIVCLADQMPSEIFCQDIQTAVPVCRATTAQTTGFSSLETPETVDQSDSDLDADRDPLHLFWCPALPDEGSPERRLARELIRRGSLLEPFERAAIGLGEVYGRGDDEPDESVIRP